MIRVLLVDDHAVVRSGLSAMLSAYDDLTLTCEAADGEAAVLMYGHHKPDIVLMDMMMPRMNGVEATRKIRERDPNAKIIALTSFDTEGLVHDAIEAGATGYLLKNTSADDLARAIYAAHSGKRTLAPEAADALIHAITQPLPIGHDLTARERDVLELMTRGLNNTQIAAEIHLSVSTIKFHVSAILSKLAVTSRVEAVAIAVRQEMLNQPSGDKYSPG